MYYSTLTHTRLTAQTSNVRTDAGELKVNITRHELVGFFFWQCHDGICSLALECVLLLGVSKRHPA